MKYAHSGEGIKATDIANAYVAGSITYPSALKMLQDDCKMNYQTAKEFLRSAMEEE